MALAAIRVAVTGDVRDRTIPEMVSESLSGTTDPETSTLNGFMIDMKKTTAADPTRGGADHPMDTAATRGEEARFAWIMSITN